MKNEINSKKAGRGISPDKKALKQTFESAAQARKLIARDIEILLDQIFASLPSTLTIKTRTKKFESYYKKFLSLLKSGNPHPLITDLVGIRIICPFIEDLAAVEELLKNHFEVVEVERKSHGTYKEFGYESTHLLIKIPGDIIAKHTDAGCELAEIQIRTILQDAWAEVEHEIFYKAEFNPVDAPMKRKLYAVNASLSLADIVFQEIRSYQQQLNGQLLQRRESFYQKVEEATDALLFSDMPSPKIDLTQTMPINPNSSSIDDLLLNALYAHNKNQYERAATVYSRILELKPDVSICSLIYKHRGMAYFAQSKYEEAIADFTSALALEQSYKVAYYRAVVYSVTKQYAEAIDDFSRSLDINPYQAFCLFRRGQAFYHIGDYPKALADCEASIVMEPHNDTIKRFRELLQSKLKM